MTDQGPLEPDKPTAEIQADPYRLPEGFEWATVDITNPDQRTEVYDLLADNYVEDDDSMFRFAYPADMLLWALTPPHYFPKWHVGVRVKASGKLYAFISGVPSRLHIYDQCVWCWLLRGVGCWVVLLPFHLFFVYPHAG